MKVRKLAVALALAGGLGSGVAQALGLGEVEIQSFLNEPLEADIALRQTEGVDPENIIVELASPQSYERLGIPRAFFLTNLRFNVERAPNGQLVVNVTSREPVKEPYLNFLVELTWPSGRLLREYSVLLDPPVYAERSGLQEQVQAPSAPAARTEQARTQQSARTQQPTRQADTTGRASNTFGPTGPSDTLWGIASSVKPSANVSTQQVMLAIQDLNPDAFLDNNINRLKRGEVLRIPSLEQVQQRSQSEANRQVRAQNQAIADQQRVVDATPAEQGSTAGGAATQAPAGDELRLIAADDAQARGADDGASAGGTGTGAGTADAGQAVALEELDRARRENEELSSRLQDMQDQVETLQRLIELKNSQLAEMQQAGTDAQGQTAPAEGEAATTDGAEPAAGAGDPAQQGGPVAVDADATADQAAAGTEPQPTEGDQQAEAAGDEAVADAAATDTATSAQQDGTTGAQDAAEPEAADAPAQAEAEAPAPAVEEKPVAEEKPAAAPAPAQSEPETKGFPGDLIEQIKSNPLYQVGLGGGLIVLLLLLLLLARRNANREKAFYDQLNSETEGEGDHFDLTLDEEESEKTAEGNDPLADADVYIAYGRLDQAAQALENAISREPSRTDLRLKLLGVYADSQDREAFEKQLGELEALEDNDATAEAEALRVRLEEAESMPSIDDLESQLRSGGPEGEGEPARTDETQDGENVFLSEGFAGFEETETSEERKQEDEDKPEEMATGFEDLQLDEESLLEDDASEERKDDQAINYDLSVLETEDEAEVEKADEVSDQELEDLSLELEKDSGEDDYSIDFETDTTLDEADELAETDEAPEEKATTEEPLDLEDEFASLDLEDAGIDNLETGDEVDRKETPLDEEEELATSDDGSLDESFLDELDAELEKVAGEEEPESAALADDTLEDLELDVSDEDLALMEEVADRESGKSEQGEELSLNDELDLEDALEEDADEVVRTEAESAEAPVIEPEEPEAETETPATAKTGSREIDESELGDEDDFDFLSGTDEAATKLDLARAYIEMGDADGARDILEEVSLEGDEAQKNEARDMLKNLA